MSDIWSTETSSQTGWTQPAESETNAGPEKWNSAPASAPNSQIAVGCSCDYSSFICIQPTAVDRVRVKMGLIFFGEDWSRDSLDDAIELFDKTMAEDKAILVELARGLKSRHHRVGPLAPADFEGPICDFYRYMNRIFASVTSEKDASSA